MSSSGSDSDSDRPLSPSSSSDDDDIGSNDELTLSGGALEAGRLGAANDDDDLGTGGIDMLARAVANAGGAGGGDGGGSDDDDDALTYDPQGGGGEQGGEPATSEGDAAAAAAAATAAAGEGKGEGEGEATADGGARGEGDGGFRQRKAPSQTQAAVMIQCIARQRGARRAIRAAVVEQYRKVWDRSAEAYYYRDNREWHYADKTCLYFKPPEWAELHRDSWEKPHWMGTEDLPSPRFLVNTGNAEGSVGAGVAGELSYEQYSRLKYGDVVPIRHDYVYKQRGEQIATEHKRPAEELPDQVGRVAPPAPTAAEIMGRRHYCAHCGRLDAFDRTRSVCLHCRRRGAQPTLGELDAALAERRQAAGDRDADRADEGSVAAAAAGTGEWSAERSAAAAAALAARLARRHASAGIGVAGAVTKLAEDATNRPSRRAVEDAVAAEALECEREARRFAVAEEAYQAYEAREEARLEEVAALEQAQQARLDEAKKQREAAEHAAAAKRRKKQLGLGADDEEDEAELHAGRRAEPRRMATCAVTLKLNKDFEEVESEEQRWVFDNAFREDVSAALKISYRRVVVDGVRPGSVYVDFTLLPNSWLEEREEAGADDAARQLRAQVHDEGSDLYAGLETSSADPAAEVDVVTSREDVPYELSDSDEDEEDEEDEGEDEDEEEGEGEGEEEEGEEGEEKSSESKKQKLEQLEAERDRLAAAAEALAATSDAADEAAEEAGAALEEASAAVAASAAATAGADAEVNALEEAAEAALGWKEKAALATARKAHAVLAAARDGAVAAHAVAAAEAEQRAAESEAAEAAAREAAAAATAAAPAAPLSAKEQAKADKAAMAKTKADAKAAAKAAKAEAKAAKAKAKADAKAAKKGGGPTAAEAAEAAGEGADADDEGGGEEKDEVEGGAAGAAAAADDDDDDEQQQQQQQQEDLGLASEEEEDEAVVGGVDVEADTGFRMQVRPLTRDLLVLSPAFANSLFPPSLLYYLLSARASACRTCVCTSRAPPTCGRRTFSPSPTPTAW